MCTRSHSVKVYLIQTMNTTLTVTPMTSIKTSKSEKYHPPPAHTAAAAVRIEKVNLEQVVAIL